MAPRTLKNTSQYDPLALPLDGTEQVEVWRGGKQYQTTLAVLGGNPGPHGESHESGDDKIGTQTPTADAIVRGDDNGQVNDWVADASISVKGKVQLASNNESAASKAVQANDSRLSNARTPTAHAASHIGGTDDLGLGTAAMLDVGVADGVCGLDSSGKVGSEFLPSYVDDVIEVANFAALPATGETGKIYVTLDDNLTYRWTGSAYVEISKSLALGETSATAYRGDCGKIAYDHSQTAHAPSNADNTQAAIVAASSKATPVDADTLALIDSQAGNALKELLWSNVKATLKTYFDTLYTASDGDTAESILSKLLTVDGPGSGLDADTLDGAHAGRSGGLLAQSAHNIAPLETDKVVQTLLPFNGAWGPGIRAKSNGSELDRYIEFGFYNNAGVFSSMLKLFVNNNTTDLTMLGHQVWNAGNVGAGWPEALAASRYSMSTRAFTNPRISSGSYMIPEGEYLASFIAEGNSNGSLQVYTPTFNDWLSIANFSTTTPAMEIFNYGALRSDGTNLRLLCHAGTVGTNLVRIG